MTIGPAPMIRIEWMSVRFGIGALWRKAPEPIAPARVARLAQNASRLNHNKEVVIARRRKPTKQSRTLLLWIATPLRGSR